MNSFNWFKEINRLTPLLLLKFKSQKCLGTAYSLKSIVCLPFSRCRVCERKGDDQPATSHHRWLFCDLWHGSGQPFSCEQQQQSQRWWKLQAEGDNWLREQGSGVWLAAGSGGGQPLLWLLLHTPRMESAGVLIVGWWKIRSAGIQDLKFL